MWPSGLRRWLKAPFRKGVGSNFTAVIPTHQTDRCRWSQAWTFFPDTPPFFSCCFWMCLRNHHQAETMSGVAQWLACWAHNPKVPGSKPGCAMVWHDLLSCIFRSASVPRHKGLFWDLNPDLSHPERESPRLCVQTMWTVTSNFSLSALVPAQEGPEKDLQPEWVCLQAGATASLA